MISHAAASCVSAAHERALANTTDGRADAKAIAGTRGLRSERTQPKRPINHHGDVTDAVHTWTGDGQAKLTLAQVANDRNGARPVIISLDEAQRLFRGRADPVDLRSLTTRVGNDRHAHCGQGNAVIAGADAASAAQDGSD